MNWLSRVFSKPQTDVKAASDVTRPRRDNPLAVIGYRLLSYATGVRAIDYKSEFTAEKAMAHPIAYRCIDKIGLAVQSVSWYVEDEAAIGASRSAQQSKTANMAALEKVLNDPNPSLSGAQLRYWMAIVYAVFHRVTLKVGVSAGKINAIYPLYPPWVEAVPDRYGNITRFRYGTGAEKEDIPAYQNVRRSETGAPLQSFAIQIVKPDLNPAAEIFGSHTALKSVGLPAAVIEMLLQRAYDTADNNPNVRHVITTDPLMTAPEEDKLRSQFDDAKVGEESSGDILLVRGTNINHFTLDDGLTDLHKKVPMDDMGRMIAGAFGVPVALLGFAGVDGSKFANNYVESRLSFFEDTIIPGFVVPFEDALTGFLSEMGYRVRFDRDTIPALQERRIENASKLSAVTFLTDDEKREMAGFLPRGKNEN